MSLCLPTILLSRFAQSVPYFLASLEINIFNRAGKAKYSAKYEVLWLEGREGGKPSQSLFDINEYFEEYVRIEKIDNWKEAARALEI